MTPERMIAMFNAGKSFTYIGLMCSPPLSRSAVAGKIWRYRKRNGLFNERDQKPTEFDYIKAKRTAIPAITAIEGIPMYDHEINFLYVLENNLCKYIHGDPQISPGFCTNHRMEGQPFCAVHQQICYRSIKKDIAETANRVSMTV